jgi:hypothetical protein
MVQLASLVPLPKFAFRYFDFSYSSFVFFPPLVKAVVERAIDALVLLSRRLADVEFREQAPVATVAPSSVDSELASSDSKIPQSSLLYQLVILVPNPQGLPFFSAL